MSFLRRKKRRNQTGAEAYLSARLDDPVQYVPTYQRIEEWGTVSSPQHDPVCTPEPETHHVDTPACEPSHSYHSESSYGSHDSGGSYSSDSGSSSCDSGGSSGGCD